MSSETITPNDFYGDMPPERIIGTECEYSLQLNPKNLTDNEFNVTLFDTIHDSNIRAIGLAVRSHFLSNGGKIYIDVGNIEYCTAESLGPREAAAGEFAGALIIKKLNDNLERQAPFTLHKSSGTFNGNEATSTGYHENYLVPTLTSIFNAPQFSDIFGSFLATRVWAGAGMLLKGRFVMSQKANGIGTDEIGQDTSSNPTDHGKKAMASVRFDGDKYDEGPHQNNAWSRVEVRSGDPQLSPDNSFLKLGITSLMLRILEQGNEMAVDRLHGFTLADRPVAQRLFSDIKTHDNLLEVRNGRSLGWLDIQEIFLDAAHELSEKILLPQSEEIAMQYWRILIDGMRRSDPRQADYAPEILLLTDFAKKHRYILSRLGESAIENNDPRATMIDLKWSTIIPAGAGVTWANHIDSHYVTSPMIDYFTEHAPNTRAAIRAAHIESGALEFVDVDWHGYFTQQQPKYVNRFGEIYGN